MTVAPSFFLIALSIAPITLVLLGGCAGMAIRYFGVMFPVLKVDRPVKSVVLAILASFPLVLAISVFQFLTSLVPDLRSFPIPYSVILYLASFAVFFFRIETSLRGKRELLAIAFLALIPSVIFELGSYALVSLLSRS